MRVVGGTAYISIAEQKKYFQWVFNILLQRLAQLLQISWATFVFIKQKISALGFGGILKIFLH